MVFSSKNIYPLCLATSQKACSFSCEKSCERQYGLISNAKIWNNIANSDTIHVGDTIHFDFSSDGKMEDVEIGGTFRVKNFPLKNVLRVKKISNPDGDISQQTNGAINDWFELHMKEGVLIQNSTGLLTQFNTANCELKLQYDLIASETGILVFSAGIDYKSNHSDYPEIDLQETDCTQRLRGVSFLVNEDNSLDNHFSLLDSLIEIDENSYKYGYYTVTVLP